MAMARPVFKFILTMLKRSSLLILIGSSADLHKEDKMSDSIEKTVDQPSESGSVCSDIATISLKNGSQCSDVVTVSQ